MINLYKELINNLGYVMLIGFIISRLKSFKSIIQKEKFRKIDLVILSIIFGGFGILATFSGARINGAIANTRIIGIMAGGILCGPFVGIFSGVIAGIHRLLTDTGSITAIPCAMTTIIAGISAGVIHKYSKEEKKWFYGFIAGIAIESIEMLMIVILAKPLQMALSIVKSIYLPMGLTNAVGISILILLIQNIFEEKEEIAAKQAKLALDTANKTLPYFRDINNQSLHKICEIIRNSIGADAVSLTDKKYVLAHAGLGHDHHFSGRNIQTQSTKRVIETGEILTLKNSSEIDCGCTSCPLKSAIIVPLKQENEIAGTLKIYYGKKDAVTFSNKSLAVGLSQIISTQFEISKLQKLKEMANEAEIKALQAQINPHFLFNALNTIISFVRINPNKARKLIINLSTYLRYNLDQGCKLVDISKEIEQVNAYVEIEKARFGDKLNVIVEIDNNLDIKIPSLIIQPLVENSIKHGILKKGQCGTVLLKVYKLQEDTVKIIVEDDGIGISQEIVHNIYHNKMKENKIGLSNVHNRLKYIYGKGLTIENLEKGTRISFIVHKR